MDAREAHVQYDGSVSAIHGVQSRVHVKLSTAFPILLAPFHMSASPILQLAGKSEVPMRHDQ